MTSKKYLQQVYKCNILITLKLKELRYLRELTQKVTPVLSDNKIQTVSSQDKLGDTIAKIVDIESQINMQIDNYIDIRNEVTKVVDLLENADQRLIIQLRYLEFIPWDHIEGKYPYSRSTIFRLHKQALKVIEKLIK